MSDPAPFPTLPAPLARALSRRGFESLTTVQEAVLDAELAGRDLRISSRTGSGKTVALGLVLGAALMEPRDEPTPALCARPRALLVAPTRELAAQIGRELEWLYAELRVGVCVVTGGSSVSAERRALARSPAVVVGTPGRLCDHLTRGALDLGSAEAIVLDEADQMLDLGFREALECLLGGLPEDCRRHLVSATFPLAVHALAARYQKNPALVVGSAPEAAHEDIAHLAYLVHPRERYAALVNVLLLSPEERTLVFVRTRADAAEVALRLSSDGFRAGGLSGEMAQAERTRTLDAFRSGTLNVLVCTDVASRGLDVPEVSRVIHAELPDSPETLTHRSGRTGRAGRKGQSVMLVPTTAHGFAESLLRGARIFAQLLPAPSPREVQSANEERLFQELTAAAGSEAQDAGAAELAERLLSALGPEAAVKGLLARLRASGPCAPQALSHVELRRPKPAPRFPRSQPSARRGKPVRHARYG